MADSFFGFDTSVSNVNDDEGEGGPSEDEYDALNDETFGQDGEEFDWEVEHEHLAEQLESSRRYNVNSAGIDIAANSQLEASLSQLVLDETDAPQRSIGSSVWKHDAPFPAVPAPTSTLKNVCTVEELERQLRQPQAQQQNYANQNYYQPRFPVILQRPPGLQAPVPLPFAPQQAMSHNMTQMNAPLNKIMSQNTQINQMGQNHNQIGQNMNQMGQNLNQMGSSMNQMGQNLNQMNIGQNVNQFMQNANKMNQFQNNQMGQKGMMNQMQNVHHSNLNQMGPNVNQMGQNMNQMSQNVNQMGHNINQMGQNMNQMGQKVNQMGQNMNQMMPNGNQFGGPMNQFPHMMNQIMPNGNQFGGPMNQFPHMMNQPRMMAPPPGLNIPRQNFSPNMGQYNPNFRGPAIQSKPTMDQQPMNQQPMNQQNMLHQPMMQPQIKANQSPINQPKVQSKIRSGDPKMQKSRIYNNSKTMTSENLVQLIQNTHPMLQFNYHNANHHPMLNNQRFNNQFVGNHPVLNRNGSYSGSRNMMNGDESVCSDESDEYAGLMTQREKQWLINIQMLQLNTGTPYIHDFYYTVFLERQSQKEKECVKEAHKANQQNHPFYSGGVKQESQSRERHNSIRHNSTSEDAAPRTYVPTQFENSLGKLQCGSVTAPRKIIDVEVVGAEGSSGRDSRAPSRASTTNPAEVPREVKRTKQLLLDIEALYLILLRLEELNDPLAISNALILKEREEKQKQLEAAQRELENDEEDSNVFLRNIESVQRRPKQDSPKSEGIDKRQVVNLAVNQKPAPVKNLLDEDKDDLINKMFIGLLHSDRVAQMLTVRKGRTLLARFLSRVSGNHSRLRSLWSKVLRALPAVIRRDDGGMTLLAPHYSKYIHNTVGWSGVLESCAPLAEALDPARTHLVLTSAFTLSCICSLIEKASTLVNTPEATANERQWSKFLRTFARALKNTNLNVAKPVQPLAEHKLLYHMRQLDSRTTIEILQRGKPAEFADLSKSEVTELLVKYLC